MGKPTPDELKKLNQKQDAEIKKLLAGAPKPGAASALAKALADIKKLRTEMKSEPD